ncbi:MAG: helix-turn-helix domain-containing protein [Leptolyngbya sp. SIO3F4]|nr:helix-turn-helix domain-containing protein [Leptolyngbya sp. SIO3F4]
MPIQDCIKDNAVVTTDSQQQVLQLHSQMFMSPEAFSYKWDMDYETLAIICCVSKATTYHWLGGQASRRIAGQPYQRILAVTDYLLTYSEQMVPLLRIWPDQH